MQRSAVFDDSFVMMFPAENTEAFLEGHNQGFAYFQGVPRTILYDNTAIAVKEITGDGERKPTETFSGLQSHYLIRYGGAPSPPCRAPGDPSRLAAFKSLLKAVELC